MFVLTWQKKKGEETRGERREGAVDSREGMERESPSIK